MHRVLRQEGRNTVVQITTEAFHNAPDIDRRHVSLGREYKGVFIANAVMAKHRVVNRVIERFCNFEIGHAANQFNIHSASLSPKYKIGNAIVGNDVNVRQSF